MPDPAPVAATPAGNATPAAPAVPKPAVSATPAAPVAQQPAAKPAVPAAQPAAAAPATPVAGTTVPLHELQQERQRRQELEAELGNLRRQPQAPPVQQAYTPIAAVDPREELNKLWDTDPRKAVQVEIMYAMDWRDRVEANLNVQADQLATQYPDFNNYRSQALSYVRTLPAHQRGAPGIIAASYQMLRGQNADQVWQAREAELMAKFQRGEITAQQLQQPAGAFSAPPVAPGAVVLSDQQLAAARMMKMSPEDYAKNIKLAPVR